MHTLPFRILIIILFAAAGVALFSWWTGKERALQHVVSEANKAIEAKDPAALREWLSRDFSYSSPISWIGEGNLERGEEKLQSFWSQVDSIFIVTTSSEIKWEDSSSAARIELRGNLKFKHSIGLAIYKYKAQMKVVEESGDWKIQRIEIPELTPGLF